MFQIAFDNKQENIFLSFPSRWIKFEEDVEESGNRWSKPHVATLSLHALFELRSLLLNGTVMLDADAHSLEEVTDLMLDNMLSNSTITFGCRDKVSKKRMRRCFPFFSNAFISYFHMMKFLFYFFLLYSIMATH